MKIIFVLILLTALSGCSLFTTTPIEVSTAPVEKVPLILPEVDLFQPRDIEWIIVTPSNYEEIVNDLSRRGSSALFALRSKDYENAALNQSDILKLVNQLQAIVSAYKSYYSNDLSAVDPVEPTTDEFPEIE